MEDFSKWWKEFFDNPENHDVIWGVDLNELPCPCCNTKGGLAIGFGINEIEKKQIEEDYPKEKEFAKSLILLGQKNWKELDVLSEKEQADLCTGKNLFISLLRFHLNTSIKNKFIIHNPLDRSSEYDLAYRTCYICKKRIFSEIELKLAFMKCPACGGKLKLKTHQKMPKLIGAPAPPPKAIGAECTQCHTVFGKIWENFHLTKHLERTSPRKIGSKKALQHNSSS